MDCFKCGADGKGLVEAISNKPKEGIIWVCRRCAEVEGLVSLNRPNLSKLKEIESVEKGDSFKKRVETFQPTPSRKVPEDESLREIVEQNYHEKVSSKVERPKDLIRNFHWVIMRERKKRKMTPSQLAEELGESETAIKMAERGVLPSDGRKLISKIEAFFSIYLSDDNYESPFESIKSKTISGLRENPDEAFEDLTDKVTSQFVTIGDLKKVKDEPGVDFGIEEDGSFSEEVHNKPEIRNKEDLRKEEFVRKALGEKKDKGFGDDSSKKTFKELHESRVGKLEKREEHSQIPDRSVVPRIEQESKISENRNFNEIRMPRQISENQQVEDNKPSQVSERSAGEEHRSVYPKSQNEGAKEDLSDDDINKLIFGK